MPQMAPETSIVRIVTLPDVDARVPRGVFALADDGNLIAMLGEAQVGVHEKVSTTTTIMLTV